MQGHLLRAVMHIGPYFIFHDPASLPYTLNTATQYHLLKAVMHSGHIVLYFMVQ